MDDVVPGSGESVLTLRPSSTSSVLVRSARLPPGFLGGFLQGPLLVALPTNETTTARGGSRSTDVSARSSLIAPQQASVLYGAGETWRQHCLMSDTSQPPEVVALEVLSGPGAAAADGRVDALVAVHIKAPRGRRLEEHVDRLSELVSRDSAASQDFWRAVGAHLPPPSSISEEVTRRVTFYDATTADPADRKVAAYALVSAVPISRLGDLRARAAAHDFAVSRVDWSGMVLRDGMALVAHDVSKEPFAPSLQAFTHSVHLDALLLSLLQRRLVDESGRQAVEASLHDPTELSELERSHFDFKRRYWRTSITDKRTSPSDVIFGALQEQLLTPLDVLDVEDRVMNGARVARTLRAERTSTEQHRLNRMVQNAGVVIGAFGLSLTAAPVIAAPSWELFALALLAGILVMLATLGLLVVTGRRIKTG